MQTLNSVRLEDKLLFPDDMVNVVPVVSTVDTASKDQVNKYVFLKEICQVDVVVGGSVTGKQTLQAGKIYKCEQYVWINPVTGVSSTEYKWVQTSFAENGKLMPCANSDFTYQANARKDGGGWSVIIHWEDPVDIINSSDPAASAIWAYTVVVRKRGLERPKTVYDGDIVAYSSVRSQHRAGVGIVDYIPEEGYSYNLFAVTRYGVATGLDDGGGTDIDWAALRESIWAGTSGLSLGATLTVNHDQFGTLTLQVVDMRSSDTTLVNPNPKNVNKRSVVLMAYTPLPRSSYDAPEAAKVDDVDNPGDKPDTGKCSVNGHCLWSYSNLRQWLNQELWVVTNDTTWDTNKLYGAWELTDDTVWNISKTYGIKSQGVYLKVDYANAYSDPHAIGLYEFTVYDPSEPHPSKYDNPKTSGMFEFLYVKTQDLTYNVHKCYYTKDSSDNYKPVSTPKYPEKVNPKLLGYYEAEWKWRPMVEGTVTAENKWDLPPKPFNTVSPDAGYVYNSRALPGFLCGFSEEFRSVLATVNVNTITDPYYFSHATKINDRYQKTYDKVFIPSYRELTGMEPPGIRDNSWYNNSSCREGKLFSFYDPSIAIPDMTLTDRSLVKIDAESGLCGYWLRSIGTVKSKSSKNYVIANASKLWMVTCEQHPDKPELGRTDVTDTHACSMTTDEVAKEVDILGNRYAPGVVWCVVIG